MNTGKKAVEFERSLVDFARAISVESYKHAELPLQLGSKWEV